MPSDPLENYKKLLSKQQHLGDRYVIVDSKWFEHWKRFAGIEKSDEEKVTEPGPIDFTNLAHPDTTDRSNEVQLRPNAVEGNDYTFIPYELYTELAGKFSKIGPEIIRKVIPYGQFDTIIEAFLVPLRLRESRSTKAKVKQIYRSRRTLIDELKKDICSEYRLQPNSNYRLLSATDEDGTEWEPINDGLGLVIEGSDLTKNAFIIYESRAVSTRSNGSASSSIRTSYIPGLCGLSNLGNTCFMNSALQCLSNVPALTEYFLQDAYKPHINRDNPLGMKGDVAQAYGELIHEMWSGKNGSYAPKSLKHSVARYAPQFSGYAQQDSQEFMSFLLDGLHEDLNLVKQKPYVDKKDDDGKADDLVLASEQWEYYRKRNQSKIHDIFHGQIKSVVKCLTCKTKGRTFDPICFLSLPLPGKKRIRTFKIDYVRLNGQIKSYSIKSNEHGRMSNLVQEFCDRFQSKDKSKTKAVRMEIDGPSASSEKNKDEDGNEDEEDEDEEEEEKEDFTKAPDYDGHQPKPDLVLSVEVYNHRIHLQYSDNASLTSIIDRDQIVFYEVPDSLKKGTNDNILMPCVFRDENTRQNFGYPIYLSIPRRDCRGKDIQEALQKTIGNFLPLPPTNPSDKPLYIGCCQMNQNYYQQTKPLESMLGDRVEFGRTNASLIVDVATSVVDKYKKRQEEEEEAKRSEKDRVSSSSSIDNVNQTQNQQKQSTTLTDCFGLFTKREILSNEDLWHCPKCKELKKASKKIDIWLLPKVLIVQLKRFNYTRYFRDKIDLLIDCPLRDLDLSEFVQNPAEKSKAKYDLIAVSNHMGGLGGGHYTAYAKNVHDQKWHTFDDSYVGDSHEDNVISRAAYVLIYQQKDQSN